MKLDYNELLREQLYALKNQYELLDDYEFIVDSEQSFIKKRDFQPNTIYVLTKTLTNDNSIGVDTQPIQILILSEQNSLDICKSFFSDFAKTYNFVVKSKRYDVDTSTTPETYKTMWVKQQYSDPVVLSNFNTISYGYRSVLYMSANLYIMYNVVDLHDLTIDGKGYTALTWDMAYTMTPNTQQTTETNEYISKSVKSVSSLAITITLPVVESSLITKVLSILDESDNTTTDTNDTLSYGGNENFYFSFYLGQKQFANKKLKLVSAIMGTAIDNVPVIRLGFLK